MNRKPSLKVVSVVGARPQFIKAASVSRAFEQHSRTHPALSIREVLVHTGQHYDYEMSEIFFEELGLKTPDYHLAVGPGTHAHQTGEMLKRIEDVIREERPDWLLVYGDTNSTLAGALAAAKLQIPVVHVEAGLRSFNRRMPEETNRVVTDHVSSLLLCPTQTAVDNLEREGISRGVHLVGDVMCDALCENVDRAERTSTILRRLGLCSKQYFLATVHRAENTDDPARLEALVSAFRRIAADAPVVWPVHPRAQRALRSAVPSVFGAETPTVESHRGVRVTDPVSYLDMLVLEKGAKVVLTDSGGVQKEAYLLGVPCVTLRDETEWVETVEAGWNRIAGTDPDRIVAALRDWPDNARPALYGDGNTSRRIAELLVTV